MRQTQYVEHGSAESNIINTEESCMQVAAKFPMQEGRPSIAKSAATIGVEIFATGAICPPLEAIAVTADLAVLAYNWQTEQTTQCSDCSKVGTDIGATCLNDLKAAQQSCQGWVATIPGACTQQPGYVAPDCSFTGWSQNCSALTATGLALTTGQCPAHCSLPQGNCSVNDCCGASSYVVKDGWGNQVQGPGQSFAYCYKPYGQGFGAWCETTLP